MKTYQKLFSLVGLALTISSASVHAATFPVFAAKADITSCKTRSPRGTKPQCFAGPQSLQGIRFPYGNFWTQPGLDIGAWAHVRLKIPAGAKTVNFNVGVPDNAGCDIRSPKYMTAHVNIIDANGKSAPLWEDRLSLHAKHFTSAVKTLPPNAKEIELVGGTAGNDQMRCDDMIWTSVVFGAD
jgi:hypothetical protein